MKGIGGFRRAGLVMLACIVLTACPRQQGLFTFTVAAVNSLLRGQREVRPCVKRMGAGWTMTGLRDGNQGYVASWRIPLCESLQLKLRGGRGLGPDSMRSEENRHSAGETADKAGFPEMGGMVVAQDLACADLRDDVRMRGSPARDSVSIRRCEAGQGQCADSAVQFVMRLQGGSAPNAGFSKMSEREKSDYADYLVQDINQYEEVRWEALSELPGFEDATPHPCMTGWGPEEYTRRGIDLAGGVLSFTDEEKKEMDIKGKIAGTDMDTWDALEEEKNLVGVCPMCHSYKQPDYKPIDYVNKHVDDMRVEDWMEISPEQLMERYEIAWDAYQANRTSHTFDAAFVYNITESDSNATRIEKLFQSIVGLDKTMPDVIDLIDTFKKQMLPENEHKLVQAALDGDPQQCAFWVRRGVDVNLIDNSLYLAYTPLHHAAEAGHASTCAKLLDLGASPFAPESAEGRTPLHLAACAGFCHVVRALVAGGTPVDVLSRRRGRTALHDAAANGQTHTINTLIELGADVRARYVGIDHKIRAPELSNAGATALHDAAEGGYTRTCVALLRAGASLHATDEDGYTARERASAMSAHNDPHCPLAVKGEVLDTLAEWEEGGDCATPPPEEDTHSLGLRALIHAEAGREVFGDGGDLDRWEAPHNYNGVQPQIPHTDADGMFKHAGVYLVERDVLNKKKAMAGVRRKSFFNPGHSLNMGQERPGRGQIIQIIAFSMAFKYREGPDEEFVRRKRAERWYEEDKRKRIANGQEIKEDRWMKILDAKEQKKGWIMGGGDFDD